MKTQAILRFMIVSIIFSAITFLSGCENQSVEKDAIVSNISPEIIQDSKEYYGKVITKSDFPIDKLLPDSYMDTINNSGISINQVGGSPETALVSLVFDENNILYTAKRYNSEAEKNNYNVGKYRLTTDINTFRQFTKLPESSYEYADVLPGVNGQLIWTFDPYVKFFTKRADFDKILEQKMKIQNEKLNQSNLRTSSVQGITIPAWSMQGNIIFAQWSNSIISVANLLGHTGGITVSPQISASTVGAYMQSTKTIEATNHGNGIDGITVGAPDGVGERWMSSDGSNYWAGSTVYNRYALWRIGMTSAQRSSIVTYMKNQSGKTYLFGKTKNSESSWYCSKLQWAAYNKVLGIDIDSNAGDYVYPKDILYSTLLFSYKFG